MARFAERMPVGHLFLKSVKYCGELAFTHPASKPFRGLLCGQIPLPARMPESLTIAEQLQQGMALHQAGRLGAARVHYESVLRVQRENSQAWHLLGLLEVMSGRTEEGIAHYRRCLGHQPDFAIAWTNLGNALLTAGRADEAVTAHRRALVLAPDLAEAHCNLGNALQALGLVEEAIISLQRAITLKPDLPQAHNNLGNLHKAGGRNADALDAYRTALKLKPAYFEAWYNLGNTLLAERRPADAEVAYARALALEPIHAEARHHLGQALRELGRLPEAQAACRKAIELRPDYAEAYTTLGNILEAGQDWEGAVAAHQQAVGLRGDLAEGWSNLGNALNALNRTGEALEAYQAARRLRPDSPEIAYNEGLVRLVRGEWADGWEGYERRWDFKTARRRPVQSKPAWDGRASLQGRSIVVYAEQGLGDTLQFARYIPLLAERGAEVHVVVQKPLRALLSSIAGLRTIRTADEGWPDCDFHCPLLSLPRAFGTLPAAVPATVPYVKAGPELSVAAAGWLAEMGPARVGAVWSGNPDHRNDHNRSVALASFAPALAAAPGWVSLQPKHRNGEEEILRAAGAVNLSDRLKDFADTAGVLSHLDLVITVDTSVAHLAGAMGVPVWILLPYSPDWRWLLGREDCAWYPQARLFRQSKPGIWEDVLDLVAVELARRVAAKRSE